MSIKKGKERITRQSIFNPKSEDENFYYLDNFLKGDYPIYSTYALKFQTSRRRDKV